MEKNYITKLFEDLALYAEQDFTFYTRKDGIIL